MKRSTGLQLHPFSPKKRLAGVRFVPLRPSRCLGPRYRTNAMTVPRGVKITDRDREILNWIGRHGVVALTLAALRRAGWARNKNPDEGEP